MITVGKRKLRKDLKTHTKETLKRSSKENDEAEYFQEKKKNKEKIPLTLEQRLKYRHHKLEIVVIINQNKINAKLYDLYAQKHFCKFETLTANNEEYILDKINRLFGLEEQDLFIEKSEKEIEEVSEVIKERVTNNESSVISLFKKLCIYIDKYNVKMKFVIKKITENNIDIILYTKSEEDSIDKITFSGTSYAYYHEGKFVMRKKILEEIFI